MQKLILTVLAVSGLILTDQANASDGWGEPHLPIVPRTADEAARIRDVTAPATDFSQAEKFETHPAGKATKFGIRTRDAFSSPSANLAFERQLDFRVGNGFFRRLWVTAPASTQNADGLGPLFNARACQRCHLKDGRGHPPENADDTGVSMFLRLSIPKTESELSDIILDRMPNAPDPIYGTQLQDKSIAGLPAEGNMTIKYEPLIVSFDDGTEVTLRNPTYTMTNAGYGAPHPALQLSPRIAPQMIGLGLLEAVPEADILAGADPEDADNDGISGKANKVWSAEFNQWMLGRFGLKAGAATVREQSAGAFSGDMGLSTSLHPSGAGECTQAQRPCTEALDGGDPVNGLEVSDEVLDLVTFYSRNLAVPARRSIEDPDVLRGKELFYDAKCHSCHTPKFVTHRLADGRAQSFQLIWPYTDMLLHDMGDGLADNRPEWDADGREWRTPPLWGIGMTKRVSGHTFFLHDGRARSLEEAILWHGGEGAPAQAAYRAMLKDDRNALIKFLESL